MTQKTIYLLFFLSLILNQGNAQTKLNKKNTPFLIPHNLTIGEQVPNIFIPKIVNDKYRSVSFKNIKEPLIILDFWAIECSSCVEALPKLDSIQNEFGNQIKILPVTYNLASAVLKFYKNNRYGKMIKLPSVVEDKYLTQWFRHWAMSHEVWIYKGKVVAITSPQYVNSPNIKLILARKPQNWPIKDDFNVLDVNKPFITKLEAAHNNYFIDISPYRNDLHADGNGFGFVRDSIAHTTKLYIFNTTIVNAYGLIWSSLRKSIHNISLEVKDKSNYNYDPKLGPLAEWKLKNGFCYESILPTSNKTDEDRYLEALVDLDKFLNLKTGWQNRKTKCTILFKTSENDMNLLKTSGDDIYQNYIVGNIHHFKNITLDQLLHFFNQNLLSNKIEINEVKYSNRIDINLSESALKSVDLIAKELQKYGLGLKEETRDIDTFVIREIN